MIEDGIYGGKGSEPTRPRSLATPWAIPLKDTAGPAVNPLIKVMNMVSLLALGMVMKYCVVQPSDKAQHAVWIGLLVGTACIATDRLGDLAEQARVKGTARDGEAVRAVIRTPDSTCFHSKAPRGRLFFP